MMEWFNLSESDRKEVLIQTGAKVGLSATAIEKDWWVTLALNASFSLHLTINLG